jgi:hypothetical protein
MAKVPPKGNKQNIRFASPSGADPIEFLTLQDLKAETHGQLDICVEMEEQCEFARGAWLMI